MVWLLSYKNLKYVNGAYGSHKYVSWLIFLFLTVWQIYHSKIWVWFIVNVSTVARWVSSFFFSNVRNVNSFSVINLEGQILFVSVDSALPSSKLRYTVWIQCQYRRYIYLFEWIHPLNLNLLTWKSHFSSKRPDIIHKKNPYHRLIRKMTCQCVWGACLRETVQRRLSV